MRRLGVIEYPQTASFTGTESPSTPIRLTFTTGSRRAQPAYCTQRRMSVKYCTRGLLTTWPSSRLASPWRRETMSVWCSPLRYHVPPCRPACEQFLAGLDIAGTQRLETLAARIALRQRRSPGVFRRELVRHQCRHDFLLAPGVAMPRDHQPPTSPCLPQDGPCTVALTVNTGQGAVRTTVSAILPSKT